jgi:hypothetical protein
VSLAFYFDEQVSRAIADGLTRRGIDVLTAQDDERDGANDVQILERAAELGRILFTQDIDFLLEAARRQASGVPFVGIVYARPLGPSIGQCIADLAIIAGACEWTEMENRIERLPL